MAPDADEAARASLAGWARHVAAVPGSRTTRDGGALGVVTGVPLPGFNGVWGEARDVVPAAVADLLDAVRDAGVPHCLQLRQGWPPEVDDLARERGLERVAGEPLMVLDDPRALADALDVPGLSLRRLGPGEGPRHAQVAAAGGVVGKEGPYLAVVGTHVLAMPGVACYVGDVDGEAVTTALAVTAADCVGIFSVATLPGHRRRGYGAAVTARAARDGLDAGARWAWLSASDAGYPVYRSLGFETVERFDIWEQARR